MAALVRVELIGPSVGKALLLVHDAQACFLFRFRLTTSQAAVAVVVKQVQGMSYLMSGRPKDELRRSQRIGENGHDLSMSLVGNRPKISFDVSVGDDQVDVPDAWSGGPLASVLPVQLNEVGIIQGSILVAIGNEFVRDDLNLQSSSLEDRMQIARDSISNDRCRQGQG